VHIVVLHECCSADGVVAMSEIGECPENFGASRVFSSALRVLFLVRVATLNVLASDNHEKYFNNFSKQN